MKRKLKKKKTIFIFFFFFKMSNQIQTGTRFDFDDYYHFISYIGSGSTSSI